MPFIKSPPNYLGSGNSKLRAIVTTAAAALIGTLVGGVSVLGIVMAVTQPPNHEIRSDMRAGGEPAVPAAPPSQQAAATTPPQQTAPVAPAQSVPPIQGPRTTWPDGLSARTKQDGPATATERPVPQQAPPPANDRTASSQNDESGAGPASSAKSGAVTSRDLPNQISPNAAPAKKRVVGAPPGQSTERTVDEAPAGDAPVGRARSETRNSQALARRSQRSPDVANQSGDDPAAASPPRRRVIIPPSPAQTANDDRGHWGGGLFDFFGQSHSDGDHWNQDRWNNDWHGSYDSHD